MKIQNLQPLTDIKSLIDLPEIKYLPGFPRKYRFDAKNGKLNFNGETDITPKGQAFTIIPLAHRIFTDEILGYSRRKWAEMFFVNQAGHVCSLLFHGYSVDQLQVILGDLYYEDAGLTDIRLTVHPEPRSNDFGNYYVASFGFEVLPPADREQLALVAESLPPIYRQDIFIRRACASGTNSGMAKAQYHAWKNVQLPELEHSEKVNGVETSEESTVPWQEEEESKAA
ncbi:hypothetical protein [Flavilitoribacter nigricans]|uniref:Uncharacterized protein n=1 Tax=Flavilitoribacter nigricans (strain ATCC 23147 / DSM 23189 / NBRC 102662 / NCIMB 1420 / SS-2) TaxID=1122177 RepID=A0A2D0N0I7_FLAN2|nr:hypothetical protein [Flavilitoribacter nigricans]PHN01888.1 hypothetical protein CRP01_35215 [Flavilitoribacter nigricans DSM 23189 = NBRC 102662]